MKYDEVASGVIQPRDSPYRSEDARLFRVAGSASHYWQYQLQFIRRWGNVSVCARASIFPAFPADCQVILQALKTYGMFVADNGSAWYYFGRAGLALEY